MCSATAVCPSLPAGHWVSFHSQSGSCPLLLSAVLPLQWVLRQRSGALAGREARPVLGPANPSLFSAFHMSRIFPDTKARPDTGERAWLSHRVRVLCLVKGRPPTSRLYTQRVTSSPSARLCICRSLELQCQRASCLWSEVDVSARPLGREAAVPALSLLVPAPWA